MTRVVVFLALFSGGVALFEMSSQQISATTGDAATALLEGESIASGHVLLQGWALSLDSFWTLEALCYAIAVRVDGVHLYLLHLIPAIVAMVVVFLGIFIAAEGRSRRGGVVGAVAVLVLLGLPSPVLAYFFLQGPWHITTALAVLIALALTMRSHRRSAQLAASFVLAFALLSDSATVFLGVLPIFGVGLFQLLRTRKFRDGAPYMLTSLLALVLALAIHEIGHALGMFTLVNRSLVVSPKQLSHNVFLLVHRIPALFGVGDLPLSSLSQGALGFQVVRAILLLLVLVTFVVGIYRTSRAIIRLRHAREPLSPARCIDGVLLFGLLGDIAFYIVGSANGHVEFTKYLTAGVIFLVIFCARSLGEFAERQGHRVDARHVRRVDARSVGVWIGSAVVACCVLVCGYQFVAQAMKTAPGQKTHQLTIFLASHHLGNGIGSYPIASLVSVDSSLRNMVRPVEANGAKVIVSFDRQRDNSWYVGANFRYLIYDTTVPWHGVDLASATKTFGRPKKIFVVGPYRILAWDHPLQVSVTTVSKESPLHIIFK
jgi:hypothetical protein